MTLTASAKGSLLAGFGVAILFWSTILHIDKIPLLRHLISRDKFVRYVSDNKSFASILSEIFNLGIHGVTNPLSVMFALGSTVVNFTFIWLICPRMVRKPPVSEIRLTRRQAA